MRFTFQYVKTNPAITLVCLALSHSLHHSFSWNTKHFLALLKLSDPGDNRYVQSLLKFPTWLRTDVQCPHLIPCPPPPPPLIAAYKLTGKALKSGNFSHWRWHLIFTKRVFQFQQIISDCKKKKNMCLQASNLAPKKGRRRPTWQLARSSSSVAR